MFKTCYLIAGIFALLVFAYAQHAGWNLFDETANSGSGGAHGSSRVYHK